MKVELGECPAVLREAVGKKQEKYEGTKVICVSRVETTPYKDKSIKSMVYTVSLEYCNLFISLRHSVCSRQEWNTSGVYEDSLTVGQVEDIIFNSDWFTGYLKADGAGRKWHDD